MHYLGTSLRLAFRNLFRHRGRFVLGAFVIGITSLLFVFASGQIGGVRQALDRGMTDSLTGHLQIKPRAAAQDFFDVSTGRRLELIDVEPLARLLARLRAHPAVEAASPRMSFGAVVGNGESSTPAMVIALDAREEARVLPDMAQVLPVLLTGVQAALVSPRLIEKTGVPLGQELLVLTETPSEVFNGRPFDVKGHAQSPVLIDEYLNAVVFTNLQRTRAMLYVEDVATDIVVRLRPEYAGRLEQSAREIESILDAQERETLKVYTFREVARSVGSVSNIATGMAAIQIGTVAFVMVVIVLILTRIGLHERRREIGCLMSLGMTRARLVQMFLLEVVLKVLISYGIGLALALALLAAIRHGGGIRANSLVEQYMNGGKVMVPVLDGTSVLLGLAAIVGVSLLATAASCWRAGSQDAVALLNTRE